MSKPTREEKLLAALRESEERYRVLAEAAADAIFTIDERSVITFANPAAERIFGYTREELIGKPLTDLMPERLRATHRAGLQRYMSTGRRNIPWGGVELPGLHKSGKEIPLELSFGESIVAGRRYFSGIARDISARKEAEKERDELLRRAQAAGAEAERASAAKDEFFATLSHELRTPLTSILGWAKMLQTGRFDDETLTMALETIARSSQAQAQLIDDALDMSRIVTGRLRLEIAPVNLAPVIEAAIDTLRPAAAAKRIELRLKLERSVAPISGDASRIQQVVWNLVANAIKFTCEEGIVEVRCFRADSHARIEVQDTGEGISPDFLPHVFERYSQAEMSTTRRHSGLGLGLTIVRQLVELHGGTVRAESGGRDKGSKFTVEFPMLTRQSQDEQERPTVQKGVSPAEQKRLETLRVLVIDDDPHALDLFVKILERSGARVDAATSVRQAIDLISQVDPDVVVSDIAMPDQDGFELMKKLRARPKSPPVIAVTALGRPEDREKVLAAGFSRYLRKPVEPDELTQAVASVASDRATHS